MTIQLAVRAINGCDTVTCPNPQCLSTDYGPFDFSRPTEAFGTNPRPELELAVHVCCACGYVCPCGWHDEERTVEEIIDDINAWAAEDKQIQEALRALSPAKEN